MKQRSNQKNRRRPYRKVGIFTRDHAIRIVELHPTKGFREQNGEGFRKEIADAQEKGVGLTLKRGQQKPVFVRPVASNKPKILHRKSG